MSEVALALIATGKSNSKHINDKGNTALIWACSNKMSEVALALIETGESHPEHVNNLNETALMIACSNKMSEVALALIETGKSKPEHVNNLNDTALMIACSNKMSEVALTLIATGKSKPEQADNYDNTALMLACNRNMTEVALALIATGESNSIHINKINKFAIDYANKNNMTEVINALTPKINTSKSSHNYIQGQDIPQIGLYHGITLEIEGVYSSLLKSELEIILNTRSMVYETNNKYVYTHTYCPIQGGLVLWNKLNDITNEFSSNYYVLIPNNNNMIGKYKLYEINVQKPECIFTSTNNETVLANEPIEEPITQIIIKYQNTNYPINVPENTKYTYENVLEILKQSNPIFASIDNSKQLIRFMFNGRIYQNKGLSENAVPGTHQLIITQRGTRGGKNRNNIMKTIKNLQRFKIKRNW